MKDLKIGTILKAINPCLMKDSGKEALIVGQEYVIIDFFINDFVVKSEVDDNHFFNVNKYEESQESYLDYFEVVK